MPKAKRDPATRSRTSTKRHKSRIVESPSPEPAPSSPPETPVQQPKNSQVNRPKREFSAIYDTLICDGYPMSELAASIAQTVSYDGDDGIAQVLNFIIRLAGCYVPFPDGSVSDNVDAAPEVAAQIDEQCALNPVAAYPMSKRDIQQKVQALFSHLVENAIDSGDMTTHILMVRWIMPLAEAQTRSLRHSASFFLCGYAQALALARQRLHGDATAEDEHTGQKHLRQSARKKAAVEQALESTLELSTLLNTMALSRLHDVAPAVRRLAVAVLAEEDPEVRNIESCSKAVVSLLDDADNTVRLEALTLLRHKDLGFSTRTWTRLRTIVLQDINAKCRASAVRLINASSPKQARQAAFSAISDQDEHVANAAARVAVSIASGEDEDTAPTECMKQLVAQLQSFDLSTGRYLGAALLARFGLAAFTEASEYVLSDDVDVDSPGLDVILQLLEGVSFEARESATRKQANTDLADLAASQLAQFSLILQRFGKNADLGPIAARLCGTLTVAGVSWQGLDTEFYALLDDLVALVFDAYSTKMLNELSYSIDQLYNSNEESYASELKERLNLAFNRAISENAPLQCLYLSKWADSQSIANLAKLNGIWENTDDLNISLVRTLGVKGPATYISRCAEFMHKLDREEDLTLVRIAAQMKAKELDYPPVCRENVSASVAAGAEAAGLQVI